MLFMGADEKYTKVRQQLLKKLGVSNPEFEYGEVTIKTGIPASTLIKKMLNSDAKILKGTTKAKAREDLLDIIFKDGGILNQLKETDIGTTTQFENICAQLRSVKSGDAFLKKFVNDPYDEETQGNRKKLKKAIDEYFKSVNQCEDTEQQDDANLVFLLIKELMAKDIERLDNKTVYRHLPFDKEDAMQHATKFNIIIRRSDHPEEEAVEQLSSLTSLKTLKYYYIKSRPKGNPDPKDLEVFKKTITEIGNLYLKLLEKGTEEEKLEFTRYFVSIWCGDDREEGRYEIVRIVNYFTSEDNTVLGEISNKLFSVDPLPKLKYNINTKEGCKALFEYYIENIVKPCAGKVEKQLQDIYQQFVTEIEAEANNYKLSLDTESLRSIPRRDRSLEIKNLKTPLRTFILDLYKECSATATTTIDTSRLSRLASNIGYMFYSSDLKYWNNDTTPYTGPNYRDFVQITCRNKIIEKCESLMKIYQDAEKSLGEFLKPYIDDDDSGIVLKLYQRSTYCIQKIYSSQFESDEQKTIIIEKSCNAVLNYIEGLLK